MSNIFQGILVGLTAISVAVAGFFGFVPKSEVADFQSEINQLETQVKSLSSQIQGQEGIFGSFTPVAGKTYNLAGSGIDSDDTSITLQSFTLPISEEEISMAHFGSIAYATLEPGTSKKEFISFTGVSQDAASSKATLTGVTRALQFTYPYTASTSLANSHSGGSKLILSNAPQLLQKYANTDATTTILGDWTWSSTNTPQYNATPTFNSASQEFASVYFVETTATSGAAIGTWTMEGIYRLATTSDFRDGIATSGNYNLVPPNQFFSTTSGAYKGVVANTSGKIHEGFISTTSNYTWTGDMRFNGTNTFISGTVSNLWQVTGTSSLATTTISKTLTVTGTTTFSAIPTLPTATATENYHIPSKIYVDEGLSARLGGILSFATTTGAVTEQYATNTLMVMISCLTTGANGACEAKVGATTTNMFTQTQFQDSINGMRGGITFFVPDGYYYTIVISSASVEKRTEIQFRD